MHEKVVRKLLLKFQFSITFAFSKKREHLTTLERYLLPSIHTHVNNDLEKSRAIIFDNILLLINSQFTKEIFNFHEMIIDLSSFTVMISFSKILCDE